MICYDFPFFSSSNLLIFCFLGDIKFETFVEMIDYFNESQAMKW